MKTMLLLFFEIVLILIIGLIINKKLYKWCNSKYPSIFESDEKEDDLKECDFTEHNFDEYFNI